MINKDTIEELTRRLNSVFPMAEELGNDVKAKTQQSVQKILRDMDILSREEFAVQANALTRAEERIAALEKALVELEEKVNAS